MSVFKEIVFQGNTYILFDGGAITTPESYLAYTPSYAHLCSDGKVRRYGEIIGSREDIEFTGKDIEVEENMGTAMGMLESLANGGWNRPMTTTNANDRERIEAVLAAHGKLFPYDAIRWDTILPDTSQWCVIGDSAFVDLGSMSMGGDPATMQISLKEPYCCIHLKEYGPLVANLLGFGKSGKKYVPDESGDPVDASAIDYKSLLKKYIAHVVACEGSDFVSFRYVDPSRFSQEEIAELRRLSKEGV